MFDLSFQGRTKESFNSLVLENLNRNHEALFLFLSKPLFRSLYQIHLQFISLWIDFDVTLSWFWKSRLRYIKLKIERYDYFLFLAWIFNIHIVIRRLFKSTLFCGKQFHFWIHLNGRGDQAKKYICRHVVVCKHCRNFDPSYLKLKIVFFLLPNCT